MGGLHKRRANTTRWVGKTPHMDAHASVHAAVAHALRRHDAPPQRRARCRRKFTRAQPRGPTCMAPAEMRFAWRRCVVTMRMATRQLCTRHDAMVMRRRPAQARATHWSRVCARPSMHVVVRRDAATAQDCTLSTRDGGTTRCASLTLNVAVCLVDCTRAQTAWDRSARDARCNALAPCGCIPATAQDCTLYKRRAHSAACASWVMDGSACAVDCTRAQTTWGRSARDARCNALAPCECIPAPARDCTIYKRRA